MCIRDRLFSLHRGGLILAYALRTFRHKQDLNRRKYNLKIINDTRMSYVHPVSYTHLDVYKRQVKAQQSCSVKTTGMPAVFTKQNSSDS